jgi:hypothetical protein
MASTVSLLLAFIQLALVSSLPAGAAKREPPLLNERAIQIASDLQPTISYSTAIESLQSASITVLPSVTGVCIPQLQEVALYYNSITTDQKTRAYQQQFLLVVVSPRIPYMVLVPPNLRNHYVR